MSGAKRGTRSRLIGWISGVAAVALVVTIAVVAAGFDARETPRDEASVWTMRSSGQYARVNTLTDEIDTVRSVEDPSGLVQLGPLGVVLSHGQGRAWNIDPALPTDFSDDAATAEQAEAEDPELVADSEGAAAPEPAAEDAEDQAADASAAMRTPVGTRDVVAAGDSVVFRTDEGEVYLSEVDRSTASPVLGNPQLLDPFAGDEDDASEAEGDEAGEADAAESVRYQANAVAVDAAGVVAVFSTQDHVVRWYDVARAEFVDERAVPLALSGEDLQLAIVADEWVLLAADAGELWREGADDPVAVDLASTPKLQASSTLGANSGVLIADSEGLWEVASEATRVESFSGAPAQPIQLGEDRFAAWLGATDGRLWSEANGPTTLEIDEQVDVPGDAELTFRTSGSSAVLSEVQTGMLWTLPDGTMIPVEQWTLNDPPKEREGTVVVNDVTEQEPPVAMDDAFGVRQGEPAQLPVLLNDYDPNRRDVLTIVPEGPIGLPGNFGEVSMLANGQSLVVHPSPSASGSASFTYRITDGVHTSDPATVTLNVVDEETNTAPGWCAVEGCQLDWPTPELAPGGTLVLPILEGWVDAEGDPAVLQQATKVNAEDPIRVLVTADGRLAVRHDDPNAPDSDVAVRVEVADSRGETTERELRVSIRKNAVAEMPPIAANAQVGVTTNLRPITRITGGSGSFQLVDASVVSGSASVAVNPGVGGIDVTASEAGMTTITVTARDTVTEAEIVGTIRITATDDSAALGLPPLRAFVRPLADSTVDVLDAIPGANSRAMVVRSANVVDGELRADVIEHSNVRVSGSTADGAPGRIGAVDVTVAEEANTSVGRMTVFQMPETGYAGAIAVADSATVRAGEVADIRVLDNDVAPPGQRLVLHPEVTGSDAEGELAFASGSTLRYLAPSEPGNYVLSYMTYSASSPESSDVGQVRVTVLPRDGNRDPQPRTLTARVAPGERVTVNVPLSGVDPDGDRVRLVDVADSDDSTVTATVATRAAAIQVEASNSAAKGTRMLGYTVRDPFGGEAEGRLRVIVTDPSESGNAPITYSDYVRLVQSDPEAAAVYPTANDIDPTGGALELVEVVPNVPGGPGSAEYQELSSRLDTSQLSEGRVLVKSTDYPSTVSYRYTVRSTESTSTADGLIVVQVSGRVGQQAPSVQDTVLTVGDRAALESGGVDVVTNRVTWSGGDVATLEMSLWGDAADRYTARGNSISGSYTAEGDLVPFRLAGIDHTGEEVETFGFLVIPSLDELRLTLKPGLSPIQVDEGESVDVSLTDLVDVAAGDNAELQTGALPTQRAQATCEATNSSTIRYSAGREAPWADTCVIAVKLAEQSAWTRLSVPVSIVPEDPVVELQPLTRTVAPGASESVNLLDMVNWQGGREGNPGNLRFSVAGGGGSFETQSTGQGVTVTARADAVPGAQDALTVTVTGAGESRSTLMLRVGEAAKDTPRGGNISLECRVGSSCQAQAIGASGEYDPFAGKSGGGLTLESVTAASCPVATFQVQGNAVAVGWPDGAGGPGGQCTATFTVHDAQGRAGQGTIELDARGVPRQPTISATGYTATSVTLLVGLSGESSHPATEGVRVRADGGNSRSACTRSGGTFECVVSGLDNGVKHSFTALAYNAVGDSEPSNAVTAWAYDRPAAPTVTPEQISAESTTSGTATLTIRGKSDVAGYRVVTAAGEKNVTGNSVEVEVAGLPVGSTEYTVTPRSQHEPPTGGNSEGHVGTGTVTIGGLPSVSVTATSAQGSSDVSATVTVAGNGGGDHRRGVVLNGTCTPTEGPDPGGPYTHTLSGTIYTEATVTACARNKWGSAPTTATASVWIGGNLPAPTVVEGYALSPEPNVVDVFTRTWTGVRYQPDLSGVVSRATLKYSTGAVGTLSSVPVDAASVQVQQCIGDRCSDWVTVSEVNGDSGARLTWSGVCVPSGSNLSVEFSWIGGRGTAPVFTESGEHIRAGWSGWTEAVFEGAICEPADDPSGDPGDEP